MLSTLTRIFTALALIVTLSFAEVITYHYGMRIYASGLEEGPYRLERPVTVEIHENSMHVTMPTENGDKRYLLHFNGFRNDNPNTPMYTTPNGVDTVIPLQQDGNNALYMERYNESGFIMFFDVNSSN